ncbi:uncharacterized protein LOC125523394 [Triticum urartu]|uniref:uncharacterized protein LOC125523394 n=1 Tax=Triticum urartu TaxID=4572 RepID=UPI00204463B8|nr:uncharacterized protein LOC125523394 [Triticum urartu]
MLRAHLRLPLGAMLHRVPVSALLVDKAMAMAMPTVVMGGGYRPRRSLHGGGGDSPSKWRKPEAGRLKLNFDGSSRHASQSASIGGVYRDHKGEFVLGYAEPIGAATSSVAELAALRRGLELALENGWSGVWVEGDDLSAVEAARGSHRRPRLGRAEEDLRLWKEIAELLPLLGDDMAVSHVRRGGNRVAHGFAKLGHSVPRPRVWRGVPPAEVLKYLQRDAGRK